MPSVFFSYTRAAELWTGLIVNYLRAKFEVEFGCDTYDWIDDPIAGGAQLFEALQRQTEDSEVFIALSHDDYFDDGKATGWELDTWIGDGNSNKSIVPIILSSKAVSAWKKLCEKQEEVGGTLDLKNTTYSDLSRFLKGDPGKDDNDKFRLPPSVSRALDRIVAEFGKLRERPPPPPPVEGDVLLTLGGYFTDVTATLEGYEGLVENLSSTLQPTGIELAEIGDQWAPVLLKDAQRQNIIETSGKRRHLLMLADDPVLTAILVDQPDQSKIDNINDDLDKILSIGVPENAEPVVGERFIWFSDTIRAPNRPDFPYTPLTGPDAAASICDLLRIDNDMVVRCEHVGARANPFARWYPPETRKCLNDNTNGVRLDRLQTQLFGSFDDLALSLEDVDIDVPLVLAITDKGIPTDSLNHVDKIRRHVIGRLEECEERIKQVDHNKIRRNRGRERRIFGVLVQYFSNQESPLWKAGFVDGDCCIWGVLPVRRDGDALSDLSFHPEYLTKVRVQFQEFRETAGA